MSGRRRNERFQPAQPWDGTFRLIRDVIVQEDGDHLVTIGHAPAAIGEELTLDLAGAGQVVTCCVRVLESRPVILEGRVRHRIRVEVLKRSRRREAVAESARIWA